MLTLAYRNLRTRPGRTLLAALAIALGVSMIFAMRIVAATVQQTAAEVRAGRLAGADLEVAAADHALLRATLALTLAARPEVAAAAPIYRRTAWVPVDYDWTGHAEDWSAPNGTLGDVTYDDGFDEVGDGATFTLAGGGRRIEVTFEKGYPAAQLFAPPGQDLIAIEPMAAPTDALSRGDYRSASAGNSATSRFSIKVV